MGPFASDARRVRFPNALSENKVRVDNAFPMTYIEPDMWLLLVLGIVLLLFGNHRYIAFAGCMGIFAVST
jgi:hypothetical protein